MSLVAGWKWGGCGRRGAGLQFDSKGCGGDLLRWAKSGFRRLFLGDNFRSVPVCHLGVYDANSPNRASLRALRVNFERKAILRRGDLRDETRRTGSVPLVFRM